jgi:hypothetical protein
MAPMTRNPCDDTRPPSGHTHCQHRGTSPLVWRYLTVRVPDRTLKNIARLVQAQEGGRQRGGITHGCAGIFRVMRHFLHVSEVLHLERDQYTDKGFSAGQPGG